MLRALSQHYFPSKPPTRRPIDARGPDDYSGWYVSRNVAPLGVGRTAIWLQIRRVELDADGDLSVSGGPVSTRFVQLSGDLFRSVDGSRDVFFSRGATGQLSGLHFSDAPASPYMPAPILDRPAVTLVWVALPALWLLFNLAFVSVELWRQRGLAAGSRLAGRPDVRVDVVWCIASAALLAGLLMLLPVLADPGAITVGRLTGLRIALTLLLFGALLVLPACALMWRLRRRQWMQWCTLLAALLLLLWLGHWQLLGYHYFVSS